jgi:hypothetical protein
MKALSAAPVARSSLANAAGRLVTVKDRDRRIPLSECPGHRETAAGQRSGQKYSGSGDCTCLSDTDGVSAQGSMPVMGCPTQHSPAALGLLADTCVRTRIPSMMGATWTTQRPALDTRKLDAAFVLETQATGKQVHLPRSAHAPTCHHSQLAVRPSRLAILAVADVTSCTSLPDARRRFWDGYPRAPVLRSLDGCTQRVCYPIPSCREGMFAHEARFRGPEGHRDRW